MVPVKNKKYPRRTGPYVHLASYDPNFILDKRSLLHLRDGTGREDFKIDGQVYSVKMNSARYHTFAISLVCVCCGLKGVVMMLDRGRTTKRTKRRKAKPYKPESDQVHFNLYGELQGNLILMTKDHIIPRSQGGLNCAKNYQTMCTLCNHAKKDKNVTLEELRAEDSVAGRIAFLRRDGNGEDRQD